jgi:hypothetical protein
MGFLFLSCGQEDAAQKELEPIRGESIFDRVIHIEPEIITEIPEVPRWCDQLELKKQRINVGDCAHQWRSGGNASLLSSLVFPSEEICPGHLL